MTTRREIVAGLFGTAAAAPFATGAFASADDKNLPPGMQPVPIPQVRPIPITATSTPYTGWGVGMGGLGGDASGSVEVEKRGYTMAEYVIAGTIDGGAYSTSLLIRRPADPARFSGTVVLETLHSGGSGTVWPVVWDALTRRGHGYALVTGQSTALETHVKPSNPQRYAGLGIPAPTRPYGGTGGFGQYMLDAMGPNLTKDARARFINDSPNSYAVFSQAAALLKSNDSCFGAPVRHIVTSGASQTGHFTIGYMMEAHKSARIKDGSFVIDGFCTGTAYWDFPLRQIGVPVAMIVNEGEMLAGKPQPYRRADSDAADDKFRIYELAACGHVVTEKVKDVSGMIAALSPDIQAALKIPKVGSSAVPSQYPVSWLKSALFVDFIDWVSKGTTPPRANRIVLGPDGRPLKDKNGNTMGGVRSSYLDVPTARYFGGQLMFQEPFGPAKLRELYGNEAGYVAQVEQAAKKLVAARYLLRENAEMAIAEAKTFSFEKGVQAVHS